MASRVDTDGMLRGAATAVAVSLPLALAADAVVDPDDPSGLAVPLFLAVLLGFVAAGWVGSRRAAVAPLTTGALAALAGFVVVQGVAFVVRAAGDDSINVAGAVFNALAAYGSGLTGAVLGERRRPSP